MAKSTKFLGQLSDRLKAAALPPRPGTRRSLCAGMLHTTSAHWGPLRRCQPKPGVFHMEEVSPKPGWINYIKFMNDILSVKEILRYFLNSFQHLKCSNWYEMAVTNIAQLQLFQGNVSKNCLFIHLKMSFSIALSQATVWTFLLTDRMGLSSLLLGFCTMGSIRAQERENHGQFTWEFRITWFASSWMENFTPSSEEKESMGESVPDVRTIVLTSFKSEKA